DLMRGPSAHRSPRPRGRVNVNARSCSPYSRRSSRRHCPAACSVASQAFSSWSAVDAVTVTYPENRTAAYPSASSASRRVASSASRDRLAVARKPPRRRSSASATSAVRACSACRMAREGLSGSITTETVRRTDPKRSGPRKSGPTSTRGHSAIQYVACQVPSVRNRRHSVCSAIGHGHTAVAVSFPGASLVATPTGPGWPLRRNSVTSRGVEDLFDRHVGVAQGPADGGDLPFQHEAWPDMPARTPAHSPSPAGKRVGPPAGPPAGHRTGRPASRPVGHPVLSTNGPSAHLHRQVDLVATGAGSHVGEEGGVGTPGRLLRPEGGPLAEEGVDRPPVVGQ